MQPDFILLHVDNPAASVKFYQDVLELKPVEASANFALFALGTGRMLGLWSRHTVQPAAIALGGAAELGFAVERFELVDATYRRWQQKGLAILQAPVTLEFGRSFVALDPDRHWLRVFSQAQ